MSPLAVIWLCSFTSGMVSRVTDPVMPQIAGALDVNIQSAALLSTAFALPWALSQPILGPVGDMLGKTRVITTGLFILAAGLAVGGMAPSFSVLIAAQMVCGIAAASVSPVGFALAADLLAPEERQVGIGRILFASISGGLTGAVGAGLLGDLIGWRGVLFVGSAAVAVTAAFAPFGFRTVPIARDQSAKVRTALGNYRVIFANPRAKVCYGAVFIEGIAIHGLMPYIAPLLAAAGEHRSTIAGLVIASFALGGAAYAAALRPILSRSRQSLLMAAGGFMAAASLVVAGGQFIWPVQAVALTGMGFGFFMLHNCIQVHMLELAPHARGSSVGMHAFSLFMGQALGPILYGVGLAKIGALPSTSIAAVAMLVVGLGCARLLPHR